MSELRIDRLTRKYEDVVAVNDVSFTVPQGELVSLLGPSGCGKSTTLNLIAGLDRPTSGRISIGERVVADGDAGLFVQPENRDLGMVLQSYALWPHMTVAQNLAYPLKLRGVSRAGQNTAIEKYLGIVELKGLRDRFPHELSGGQQQRVALARTLIYQPSVLLLDEPLSNIDSKLRERARIWLRGLQRTLGVTTIFVTHDQIEALTMSDRVAVMSSGRIVQFGTPIEIFRRPESPFVADFIGSSNFLRGTVTAEGDGVAMDFGAAGHVVIPRQNAKVSAGKALVAIRPERMKVSAERPARGNWLIARISHSEFVGSYFIYHAVIGEQTIRFHSNEATLRDQACLSFEPGDCLLFPDTEETI